MWSLYPGNFGHPCAAFETDANAEVCQESMQGVTTCYQHLSSSCKETVKPWKLRVLWSRIGFERFPSHITISACNLQTCWKNSFWKDEKALNRSCSGIESQDRSNARPQNCSWSRCYRASMPYVDAHAMPFLDGMEGMETGYPEGWWVDKQLDGCQLKLDEKSISSHSFLHLACRQF